MLMQRPASFASSPVFGHGSAFGSVSLGFNGRLHPCCQAPPQVTLRAVWLTYTLAQNRRKLWTVQYTLSVAMG